MEGPVSNSLSAGESHTKELDKKKLLEVGEGGAIPEHLDLVSLGETSPAQKWRCLEKNVYVSGVPAQPV